MDTLAHHLVSALFNGAYQGLLLTAVVGGTLLLLFRRTNAATRHAIGLAALAMVAALPLIHFILQTRPAGRVEDAPQSPAPSAPTTADGGPWTSAELRSQPIGSPDPHASAESSEVPVPPEMPPSDLADNDLARASVAGPDTVPPDLAEAAEAESRPPAGDPTPIVRDHAGRPAPPDGLARPNTWLTASPWRWEPAFPARVAGALASVWAVIALCRLGRLLRQYVGLRRLTRRGATPPEAVLGLFAGLSEQAGVPGRTRLVSVADLTVPMVAGFWRPVVLLPTALAQRSSSAELEHVLRHELAHVQRHDTWANLFQQGVRALLFFHPAVWWWSRRLAVDREIACDDHVLAATRAPRAYALFLTEFAGQVRGHRWLAAPAGWNTHSQLKERITMLLDSTRNTSTTIAKGRVGSLTAATLVTAAAALWAGPRLALAGDPNTEASSAVPAAENLEATAPTGVNASVRIAPALTPTEVQVDVTRPHVVITPDDRPGRTVVSSSGSAVVWGTPPAVPTPQPAPEPPRAISRVAPVPAPHPVPPAATIAPAPAVPLTPRVLAQNQPNRPPSSLERRLERLERLVESLLEGNGLPRPKDAPHAKATPDVMAPPPVPTSLPPAHPRIQEDELQRIQEKAAVDAQRAMAAAERQLHQAHARTESRDIRRKALEAQKMALERQVRDLERQLERLEQQRDKLDEQQDQLDEQESARDEASEDCEEKELREQ